MTTRNPLLLTAALAGLLLLPFSFAAPVRAAAWSTTAAEHETIRDTAKKEGKPFLIFFYADWCGYCQQFSAELLDDPKVERFLSQYPRVMINPEKGKQENVLSMRYNVPGFPDFRVVHPDGRSIEVIPFNDDGKTLGAEEFIAQVKEALAGRSE